MSESLRLRIAISTVDFSTALWRAVTARTVNFPGMSGSMATHALIESAVIAYSRPFTKSYGTEPTGLLHPSDIPAFALTAEETKQHALVLRLRHKVIAHSDNELRQAHRVEGKGFGGKPWAAVRQTIVAPEIDKLDLPTLEVLSAKALMACSGFVFEPSGPESAAALLKGHAAGDLPGLPGDVRPYR